MSTFAKAAAIAMLLGAPLPGSAGADRTPATAPDKSTAPLAGLPSAPAAHLEKIKALGEGAWLNLGPPAGDPKWGRARGRAWAPHMPYAAELRAAFLTGEGVHGFSKPDGHYMDDLWAYDVNAHRWVCIYPGANIKNLTVKMDTNGFLVDATGQPIPIAQMGHAYEQVTYDTDRKKFVFMPCAVGNFKPVLGPRLVSVGGGYPWPYVPVNCSPWMYDPAAGRFELLKVKGPFPGGHIEGGILTYVPGMAKMFHWRCAKDVWFYDPAANAWSNVKPKGPPPPFGLDAGSCLDSKRDRIYLGGGYYPLTPGLNAFWCYDLKTNEWLDLKPKGKPCGGCNRYGPTHAVMTYDSASDVVLLFYHHLPVPGTPDGKFNPGPAALGVYVYDPATNSWTDTPAAMPKEIAKGCVNSFYSPDLNAHFFHVAGDSRDNGLMWAYRYKRAKS